MRVLKALLGGLLLLLLLLGSTLIFCRFFSSNFYGSGLFNLLLFLLLGNKETNNVLALDHVVLIDLELTEDVVNLRCGELVSPGHECVLEHTGIDLALNVVSLEGLDDEVIGVIALTSHLALEHLDHGIISASTADLSQHLGKLILRHQLADIVEGSSEIILIDCAILVNVHKLEALLVHLQLFSGESAFILTLAHGSFCIESKTP